MVSSDFGKLDVMRHLISGEDCAIAGEATTVAAAPAADTFKKSRRFIYCISWVGHSGISEQAGRRSDCRASTEGASRGGLNTEVWPRNTRQRHDSTVQTKVA